MAVVGTGVKRQMSRVESVQVVIFFNAEASLSIRLLLTASACHDHDHDHEATICTICPTGLLVRTLETNV